MTTIAPLAAARLAMLLGLIVLPACSGSSSPAGAESLSRNC